MLFSIQGIEKDECLIAHRDEEGVVTFNIVGVDVNGDCMEMKVRISKNMTKFMANRLGM